MLSRSCRIRSRIRRKRAGVYCRPRRRQGNSAAVARAWGVEVTRPDDDEDPPPARPGGPIDQAGSTSSSRVDPSVTGRGEKRMGRRTACVGAARVEDLSAPPAGTVIRFRSFVLVVLLLRASNWSALLTRRSRL